MCYQTNPVTLIQINKRIAAAQRAFSQNQLSRNKTYAKQALQLVHDYLSEGGELTDSLKKQLSTTCQWAKIDFTLFMANYE